MASLENDKIADLFEISIPFYEFSMIIEISEETRSNIPYAMFSENKAITHSKWTIKPSKISFK